jgi:hypothetical protein
MITLTNMPTATMTQSLVANAQTQQLHAAATGLMLTKTRKKCSTFFLVIMVTVSLAQ